MEPLDDATIVCPAQVWLSPEVPLSVHLIRGADFSVLVDSGVSSMYEQIRELILGNLDDPHRVKVILNTHSHHDHMGCNSRLKAMTGALVAASGVHAAWHSNFELQYREFAQEHPELVSDTPELRSLVWGTIDAPHRVDLHIDDGFVIDLGDDVLLETVALPGHIDGELGFVEHRTRTLLLGDCLTGVDWSFFHGYSDVDVYLRSLARMRSIIHDKGIRLVRAAHYPCLTADEALAAIAHIEQGIATVDMLVQQVSAQAGEFDLRDAWLTVSDNLRKDRCFRGLRLVEAHLRRLVANSKVSLTAGGRYRSAAA